MAIVLGLVLAAALGAQSDTVTFDHNRANAKSQQDVLEHGVVECLRTFAQAQLYQGERSRKKITEAGAALCGRSYVPWMVAHGHDEAKVRRAVLVIAGEALDVELKEGR